MGFRFSRRITILPGVSINLGKNGASMSVGPRGAKINFSSKGTRASVGIPGTGMRYEQKLSGPVNQQTRHPTPSTPWGVFLSVFLILWCVLLWKLIVNADFTYQSTLVATIIISGVGASLATVIIYLVYLAFHSTKSRCQRTRGTTCPRKFQTQDCMLDEMESACYALYNFLKEIDQIPRCQKELNETEGLKLEIDTSTFSLTPELAFMVYCDARDIYARLGHSLYALRNREGAGYAMLVTLLVTTEIDLSSIRATNRLSELESIVENLSRSNVGNITIDGHENELRFPLIFGALHGEHDWVNQYATLLYRWASLIAKADGSISLEESEVLQSIMNLQSGRVLSGNVKISGEAQSAFSPTQFDGTLGNNNTATHEKVSSKNGLEQLSELIGLESVKSEVQQLASFIEIQRAREKNGLRVASVSYHCVFTGNPGTGKTTVARILAEIYREMGVIKKGHLVETDRSGLVAEYVGQTAVKTNKIIDSALDGILFIDEAYSLVQGGGRDYGGEAIATLLKRMEDDRKRLVVILAGYTDEMKQFIDSNPGLQSRFNRYIEFPDYSAEELTKIFLKKAEACQYTCDESVQSAIVDIMRHAVATKDRNFGNARFVRNLFEKAIQRQANRLAAIPKLTSKMLTELTVEDIRP